MSDRLCCRADAFAISGRSGIAPLGRYSPSGASVRPAHGSPHASLHNQTVRHDPGALRRVCLPVVACRLQARAGACPVPVAYRRWAPRGPTIGSCAAHR